MASCTSHTAGKTPLANYISGRSGLAPAAHTQKHSDCRCLKEMCSPAAPSCVYSLPPATPHFAVLRFLKAVYERRIHFFPDLRHSCSFSLSLSPRVKAPLCQDQ
jgi:hypothetical protein